MEFSPRNSGNERTHHGFHRLLGWVQETRTDFFPRIDANWDESEFPEIAETRGATTNYANWRRMGRGSADTFDQHERRGPIQGRPRLTNDRMGYPEGKVGQNAGRRTVKVVPWRSVLTKRICPPCNSTQRFTMVRPRPVPGTLPTLTPRWNDLNNCF